MRAILELEGFTLGPPIEDRDVPGWDGNAQFYADEQGVAHPIRASDGCSSETAGEKPTANGSRLEPAIALGHSGQVGVV
jgi:hypothetical protein